MNSSALESRDHGLEITTLENVDHKYHNLVISCAFSFRALSETVIVFVEKAKRHRTVHTVTAHWKYTELQLQRERSVRLVKCHRVTAAGRKVQQILRTSPQSVGKGVDRFTRAH